eukprot:CAMPEP_0116555090 /NCGR_PEP_ID=MMETSP0397-20121206/7960_1 /TAXON_ID=216820 /ORGANISM="Cyclophora tenuis, Strain ECT3854" /LENGTH=198 /DNA_ID=CAMNT_0004080335 /DNA_START=13 /DNA_END=609 /DNA_ORIENTATION=+
MTVEAQRFAEITDASGLGLSYSGGAYDKGQVDEPIVSFYLGAGNDGELTFGGYDDSKFEGNLTKHSVIKGKIGCENITAAGYSSGSTVVVIDSGSAFITVPKIQMGLLAGHLGVTKFGGLYYIPCHTPVPFMVITIDGTDYTVPGKSLVVGDDNNGWCMVAFQDNSSPNQWILGDVFMRSYYTVFNFLNETVSLAKAK